MSLRIEETFELRASVDRVWSYLVDPRQVVDCLPGAELTEVKDDSTFLGRVKVKVGPVTAAYNGKVTITNRDDGAHVVSMVGEGREAAGSGSAKMTMTSRLASLPTGVTQVRVTADVDIVGKAAQFGRGMIETVNKQLFKQFTECVRTTLEPPADHPPSSATNEPVSPSTSLPFSGSAAPSASPRAQAEPLRILPMLVRAAVEMLGRWVRAARQRLTRQRGRGVV
jgi:uncharacterized protein